MPSSAPHFRSTAGRRARFVPNVVPLCGAVAVAAAVMLAPSPSVAQQSEQPQNAPEASREKGEAKPSESEGVSSEGDDGEATGEEDRKYPPEVYDPAWAKYREAFVALAAGDEEVAKEKLQNLRAEHQEHPAAIFAGPVLERLRAKSAKQGEKGDEEKGERREEPVDRLGVERPTGLARAELVSFQTAHGIALGGEVCVAAECSGARPIVASLVLGGGAGLGASLLLTDRVVAPGRALAINSGTEWGLWNAVLVNSMTENWSSGPASAVLPLMFGQLAGLAAGEGVWRLFRPYSGDVALYNSAGLWGGVLTRLFVATADLDHSPAGLHGALLAATNLGAVGGGVLASSNPMARGRVYVINSGGIVGGLLGLGTVVLIAGGDVTGNAATGASMVGAAAGLGTTTLLTRRWPIEGYDSNGSSSSEKASLFVAPGRLERGLGLTVGGTF